MTSEQNQDILVSKQSYGTGRPLVLLVNKDSSQLSCAEKLAQSSADSAQTHLLVLNDFGDNWREALGQLLGCLELHSIRTASFIAFGDCTVLVQALCFKKPRMIRSLVFINPATRAQPTRFVKFVEKVESFLPLGLPFRSDFPGFDGKPFLQRIRSPLLIVSTSDSDPYLKTQAQIINSNVPTSFLIELDKDTGSEDLELAGTLKRIIEKFQEIPVKSPQKNLNLS